MPTSRASGVTAAVELHSWERGAGRAIVCIHETCGSSEEWRPLAEALADRARMIAYDRRGWGRSPAPEPYTRTTIHEQATDASLALDRAEATGAIVCGAGLGGVTALALALQRPELVSAAVVIEPPLLAFVDGATEMLSEDGNSLREAVNSGGPAAGVELYLSGGLPALGPGAERLPRALSEHARERPLSLFAELGAVPAWPLPLTEMARNRVGVRIVVSDSSPPVLRQAADALERRLVAGELRSLKGRGLPQLDDPTGLAALILELP
jgi:pimeloyl-ACP methyl ester carboxylesterase